MKTALPAICQRIAQLPAKLGITEYEFARTIGKPQSVIQNITVKGHKPGFDMLEAIAETHRLNYEWLMQGRGTWQQNSRHKLVTRQTKVLAK
jgi:hypothetical protein